MINRRLLVVTMLVLTIGAWASAPTALIARADVPAKLTDQEFWQLSQDLSEPDGTFGSDTLLSNETGFQRLLPDLVARVKPGGVYLGVPEQNFTYIATLQPKMVFIIDIRRGNLLLHLMYKALFELSADRAEFVSRLFTKKRPGGLGPQSTVDEIMNAYWFTDTSEESVYKANLAAIFDVLVQKHGLKLSEGDRAGVEYVYHAFYWYGPSINYSSSTSQTTSQGVAPTTASYGGLMVQTDGTGQRRGYLASEANFLFLKDLHARNLIVPVVGNFGGPKALRAVGDYVRKHDATVNAFYVSNVEQYLRQANLQSVFCGNVATLPLDETSTFIRPGGSGGSMQSFQFVTRSGTATLTTSGTGATFSLPVSPAVPGTSNPTWLTPMSGEARNCG